MKKKIWKTRALAWVLVIVLVIGNVGTAFAETSGPQIEAPSALLMEASTGTVIYEKDADIQRNPASVTKIMTLILIFDALQSGKIKLSDQVVTSAHAKSMSALRSIWRKERSRPLKH